MTDDTAGASAADKRLQGVRLRKLIDVVVEDRPSSMLFRGAIADISETGMRIVSDQYLPKNTTYVFTMKGAPRLSLRAEVRWIREFEPHTYRVGVEFVGLSESDRKHLSSFIDLERRRLAIPD